MMRGCLPERRVSLRHAGPAYFFRVVFSGVGGLGLSPGRLAFVCIVGGGTGFS